MDRKISPLIKRILKYFTLHGPRERLAAHRTGSRRRSKYRSKRTEEDDECFEDLLRRRHTYANLSLAKGDVRQTDTDVSNECDSLDDSWSSHSYVYEPPKDVTSLVQKSCLSLKLTDQKQPKTVRFASPIITKQSCGSRMSPAQNPCAPSNHGPAVPLESYSNEHDDHQPRRNMSSTVSTIVFSRHDIPRPFVQEMFAINFQYALSLEQRIRQLDSLLENIEIFKLSLIEQPKLIL